VVEQTKQASSPVN
jgi:hypothetical protein